LKGPDPLALVQNWCVVPSHTILFPIGAVEASTSVVNWAQVQNVVPQAPLPVTATQYNELAPGVPAEAV
jgi:hypothetical protein